MNSILRSRPAPWLLWVGLFLGLTLVGGAWAVATPYGGTPDERAHVYHAAGVASGDFFARPAAAAHGTGVFHTVPAGIVQSCATGGIDDICRHPADPHKPTRVGTYVGRYNPIYYAVVGWPLDLWPSLTGLLVARMLSVLLVAATLTAAAWCAARWSRHRVVIPALICAGTPMLFHLMGAVNPNALEIAAGTLFFCAMIPLTDVDIVPSAAFIRLAGLAAIMLATLRGFGPAWLAIGLFAALLGVPRDRLRELSRSATLRRWSLGVAVFTVLGVLWTVLMKATQGAQVADQHVTAAEVVKVMFLVYWGALLVQMVGNLGYLSTALPSVVIFAWAAVVGFFVLGVAVLGRRAARYRILVLLLASVAIPTLATASSVNTMGFFWQGRYSLPLAVGIPILAAQELAASGILNKFAIRRLAVIVVTILLPAQLLALVLMLIRWQNAMAPIGLAFPVNPLRSTGWRPALGALPPLLAMTVGLVIIGWLCIGYAAARIRPPATTPSATVDTRPSLPLRSSTV